MRVRWQRWRLASDCFYSSKSPEMVSCLVGNIRTVINPRTILVENHVSIPRQMRKYTIFP